MKKLHGLILISILIFLLRLPFLFEPHWYFDEAVYLTISQALRRGEVLYRNIYDLKPPLIYFTYFLCQSHLLTVRLLATICVVSTSIVIFHLGKGLLPMLIFAFLASTTIFEGGVANTEIFMILPISLAFLLAYQNRRWTDFFWVGFLFGLAFLFKIVAIFDLAALVLFLFLTTKKSTDLTKKLTFQLLGFLVLLVLIFLYFFIKKGVAYFISSAFLYNASYINQESLWIKFFLLSSAISFIFLIHKKISNFNLLIYLWFAFSLFGALFGGRPYPHYLIPVLPSFSLIIASSLFTKPFAKKLPTILATLILICAFIFAGFYRYPIRSYYKNFFLYATNQKSQEEYFKFFNPLLPSIYKTASYLKKNSSPNDSIFVFADYPQIYELSGVNPATRFIATRHLDIVPGAKEEVTNSLTKNHPKFIIVFYPEEPTLPQLGELIKRNYYLSFASENIKVFQSR